MGRFHDFSGIRRRPAAAITADRSTSADRSRPESHRQRRRRCPLVLERLEDRLALSTFMVTNLGDGGAGSLRQAVVQSNTTPGPNEIDFADGLTGTITLTTGQLTITNNDVTLVGPGADRLSVSGNNASRGVEGDAVAAAFRGLTNTGGPG